MYLSVRLSPAVRGRVGWCVCVRVCGAFVAVGGVLCLRCWLVGGVFGALIVFVRVSACRFVSVLVRACVLSSVEICSFRGLFSCVSVLACVLSWVEIFG